MSHSEDKTEERFLVALRHMPITIFQQDRDLRYTWIHNLQVDLQPEDVIGKRDEDFVPPDYAARLKELKSGVLGSGKGVNTEVTLSVLGERYSYNIIVNPLFDDEGNVSGITGITWDITGQKQTQEALHETQAILKAALDTSQIGIAIADAPDGKLRYVNDAGLLIRGGDRKQVVNGVGIDQYVGKWQLMDFTGRPLESDEVPLARALKFGETCSREFIIRRSVEDDRIVLANASPIRNSDGKVIAGIAVFIDITERRKTEEELHLNELRLQLLVDLHKTMDAPQQQIFEFANDAITKSLQSPLAFIGLIDEAEEVLTIHQWSMGVMTNCAMEEKPIIYNIADSGIWGNCIRQRRPFIENDYQETHAGNRGLPDGHVPIARFLAVPVFDGEKIVAVAAAANKSTDYLDADTNALLALMNKTWALVRRQRTADELRQMNELLEERVSERAAELIKTNEALRATELKYRTIADFTYDWEYWVNENGEYNYVSPACERITGYSTRDFLNDKNLIGKIIHPDDLGQFTKHITHQLKSPDACELEFRISRKDGTERWIGHACQPVYGTNGEFLGRRSSNRDITEKVKAETELLNVTIDVEERERNRFARDLHDGLGPLFSTIKLYFQWLAETNDPEKIRMITEKGNKNIERAIQTTREVANSLSSQFLADTGYVDAIHNFTQLINDTEKLSIDFTFNSQQRFSNILELTLYRITTELINNTLIHSEATHVKINFKYQKIKKTINFTYQDNGNGFDLAELERKGGGFGLMNIRQRIKVIGGTITITTRPGNGIKVAVSLPVLAKPSVDTNKKD